MIQIRKNTFETNSSSTHSLIVCDDTTWERFLSGELYVNVTACNDEWTDMHPFICSLSLFLTDEEYEKAIPGLKKEWQLDEEDEDEYDVLSEINEELANNDIYEYDYYVNNRYECLESEETTYTTPGGETIRILCHYGYDG